MATLKDSSSNNPSAAPQEASLVTFVKDLAGTYVECSEAFADLCGHTKETVLGKTDADIFAAPVAHLLQEQAQYVQNAQIPSKTEFWLPIPSEESNKNSESNAVRERLIEATCLPHFNPNTQKPNLLGIFRDLSSELKTKEIATINARKYASVIESSKDGFCLVDTQGKLLEVNAAYCRYSGYSKDELLLLTLNDLEPERSTHARLEKLQETGAGGGNIFDSLHQKKDGSFWPVEVSASYSDINDGCFFIFVRDITERRLAEELAALRYKLSEMVFNEDSNLILREALDTAERLTYSKIGFFHFIKEDAENISLQTWSTRTMKEMCHIIGNQQHYPVSQAGVWVDCVHQNKPVIHNDYPSLKHKQGMPDGHPPLLREVTVPLYRNGKIAAVIGLGNKETAYTEQDVRIVEQVADLSLDYSERIRAEQQIKFMAYYDPLTNLPNRQLFSERLNQALAKSKRSGKSVAVCYLDLDYFKPINDQYGHGVGDKLLSVLSNRLKTELRKADTLARLGGDEFALILNGLSDISEAEDIVQRILVNCASTFDIDGLRLNVSASIGITCYPQDYSDADTLLRNADQAMYQAKKSGKNKFQLYTPIADQKQVDQEKFLAEFKTALTEQQLVLHYQPRIDLKTSELTSVEALVRWNHPTKGLLAPGHFLSSIASTPLEIALDEWVIESALKQHLDWQTSGLVTPVSVNVTPGLIQQQAFPSYLGKLLKSLPEGIANFLELEILETSAIGDLAKVSTIMKKCSQLGVSFSLDDFGTGFSSLTYFHSLPIEVLKIDQSFVRSMLQNPSNQQIVEGVIHLAESINRPVVAEGVENKELGYMLSKLGCKYAQGFGIAKPMPPEQLLEWTKTAKNKPFLTDFVDHKVTLSGTYDLDVAILAVINWRDDVKACLLDSNTSIASIFVPNSSCFTQWYHGLGARKYGHNPQYPFLLARHDKLYVVAEEIKEKSLVQPVSEKDFQRLNMLVDELVEYLLKLTVKELTPKEAEPQS